MNHMQPTRCRPLCRSFVLLLRGCCQCIFETLLVFKIQVIILCMLEVKQAVIFFWEQVSSRQIRKKSSSFILLHCSCCGSLECAAIVFLRLALFFIFLTFSCTYGTQCRVPQLVKLFIEPKLCWQYRAVSKDNGTDGQ